MSQKHTDYADPTVLYSLWYLLYSQKLINVIDNGDDDYNVRNDAFEAATTTPTTITTATLTIENLDDALENGEIKLKKHGATLDFIQDTEHLMANLEKNNIKCCDLGLTCVCLEFARFIHYNQYHLIAYNMKFIPEFETVEQLLYTCSKTIQISHNLAIEPGYSLRDMKYCGHEYIKLKEFIKIIDLLKVETVPENFIALIKNYHIRIIETFYCLVSNFGNSKSDLMQCRELTRNAFHFKFPKPRLTDDMTNCNYWLHIPTNSAWFAYHQNRVNYKKKLTSRAMDVKIQRAFLTLGGKTCPFLIFGFITPDNLIYPIFLDSTMDWDQTVAFINKHKLRNAFNKYTNADNFMTKIKQQKIPINQIYFVSDTHNRELFKMKKK